MFFFSSWTVLNLVLWNPSGAGFVLAAPVRPRFVTFFTQIKEVKLIIHIRT